MIFLTSRLYGGIKYEGEARKFILKDKFKCPSTNISFSTPNLNSPKLNVFYEEATLGITWRLFYSDGAYWGRCLY